MTYSNKIIILFILISSSLKASAINVTSIFFYQDKKIIKKDTSFQYVNNLYIEKKYPEALKETLILYNKAKEENNLTLMHKSSELLGEIYRKSFNYNLSLKYFKISLEYLIEKNKGINDNFNNKSSINLLAKSYLKNAGQISAKQGGHTLFLGQGTPEIIKILIVSPLEIPTKF